MDHLEKLREKLYEIIELGDTENILKLSHELDKLIVEYTQTNYTSKKVMVL